MQLDLPGGPYDLDDAIKLISAYPTETVRWYDLGAESTSDEVTPSDLGRMVLLNTEVAGNDAAALLKASPDAPWSDVPTDADLASDDADPEVAGGLYDHADLLYRHFDDLTNIGPAKASKLLHLKRPSFFPILDGFALEAYRDRAEAAAASSARHDVKRLYWAAIRNDLRSNRDGINELREELRLGDEHQQRVARLTEVRILDIIVWMHASR